MTSLSIPFIGKLFIRETERGDFIFLFTIGTGLQVVALLCCVFSGEKPFNYEKHYNQRQRLLEQKNQKAEDEAVADASSLYSGM
jgi:hypothetical protein